MFKTAKDIEDATKTVLRREHEFDSEPDKGLKLRKLIEQVQVELNLDPKHNSCVSARVQTIVELHSSQSGPIHEFGTPPQCWIEAGNLKKVKLGDLSGCGEEVSQNILAERAVAKRAATTSNIVDTLVHELKKKEREFSKADVKAVLGELKLMMANHLGEEGPGKFTIPGLCSIKVVDRTAAEPVKVDALADLKAMAKKNA